MGHRMVPDPELSFWLWRDYLCTAYTWSCLYHRCYIRRKQIFQVDKMYKKIKLYKKFLYSFKSTNSEIWCKKKNIKNNKYRRDLYL